LREQAEPYPFDVAASMGATRATAKGTVTGLQDLTAVDAAVEISGGSVEQLFPLLGIALPDTRAYRTSGRVVHQGKLWRYDKFSAHVGDSDITGTLQVDTAGKRPMMRGDIVFGLLDVADLGATIGTHRTSGRALPDARFNPDRWGSVDADLQLSAREIVRPQGLPLEHFTARLRLRDAVLTLDPLDFGIAGGQLSGTIRLDGRQDPIRARAKIAIAKLALDRLVPGFGGSQVDPGRVDGSIDLSGAGDSVAGMLGDASGSAAVLVNGGHVSRLLMEEIGLHVPRILALKLGGDQRVAIRCAAADFAVKDGIMDAREGVFDTTVTRVDAGGTVNLQDETLDLTLNPNTKVTSLVSLRTPIHVRGTFTEPDVKLEKGPIAAKAAGAAALAVANPLLALIPLMETGPGRDSDCGKLLTESQAAQNAKKSGVKPPPARE
jgi:AsmA protein